ncbi:MAG: TraX family protein [Eubacteriales bacterium]|nr:TraX family protein [Eubacteriales bacterium]
MRGYSGNQLKMIACLLMLCDHIGCMLIENGVLYGQNPAYWTLAIATPEGQRWLFLARVLRIIGRMAFPIFAFLAVEGFCHTSNVKAYLSRILICALVSEIPFNLACYHSFSYPGYQNTCFTIFIGLLTLCAIKMCQKRQFIFSILVVSGFSALAQLLKTDYGAEGVILISVMYMLRNDNTLRLWAGAAISFLESFRMGGVSALSFVLLRFYNGKRGSRAFKYFFYLFYPLHMLIFYFGVVYANR